MTSITKLKVNYLEQPIGIEGIFNVGWQLRSDGRNLRQQSYRLQIGDGGFGAPLYDSGTVESDNSTHVRVPEGLPLEPLRAYAIRVQATTTGGETTPWCESRFVTALRSGAEWQAEFITIETEADWREARSSYLKKALRVEKPVKAAYLLSTALGVYHVYLNGQKVGQDQMAPGWTSYNRHLLYQIHEVTEALRPGENVLTGFVNAGWYKGKMGFLGLYNHYGTRAAFACELHLEYADGTRSVLRTDESWRGAPGPVVFSEIYDGETYDARQELADWADAADTTGGWRPVSAVPFGTAALAAQPGCRVRVQQRLPVREIITTPQGDTVLDFGQNLTGWVEFKVRGKAGDEARLQCFEALDRDGNVYLDNLRSAKQTLRYICKDEAEAAYHPFFSFQGFRYAKIVAWPGTPRAGDFTACVVHSDMPATGSFSCSNPLLNQLQHNILWGMKGNFLDVPTDCPQRDERLGWTGDAQIFARTASYLMDTSTFFAKWLRDLAADQTPDGGVPHVVPDILIGKSEEDRFWKDGDHSAAAWGDAAVIVPWTLYQVYGDTEVIRRQYDSMKGWIEFMRSHAADDIWSYRIQMGDWVALDAEPGSYFGATPIDLTCAAYYAYSTGLFAKMARVIGQMADAEEYGRLHEQIAASYRRHFFDETGHLKAQTQTAQIITLYFGLCPAEYRQNVVDDLLKLLEKEDSHLVTGFVGTPYFCFALSENGHTKEAYNLLLKEDYPSWLYQVKMGATTIWEHWDGIKPDGTMWSADMNSFNHYAYGAVGDWLYRVAAGIDTDEDAPGYRHIRIAPHPGGGLTEVDGRLESIYGPVRSHWTAEGETVTLTAEIPPNTTATLLLPGATAVLEADGLAFAPAEGGGFAAETGSGVYTVKYRL
ncbi:glycoside hydrolase family 78 protein [Ruminococcaceae bacterium OttesenSCG-928-A11]|nr:glycoside hydrolase family 78 protein [Ruminococcaceae bacterium OttesenSCG-928-A11]